jgi:hypothetical protein
MEGQERWIEAATRRYIEQGTNRGFQAVEWLIAGIG